MPDILEYYYRHGHPGDCFMNSLTGVGYIHEASFDDSCPEPQRKQILEDYARISGRYQELIDATTMSTLAEMAPERLETLASIEGIQGIFANYGRTHVTTSENLLTIVDEKPVFRSVNAGPGDNTFTLEGRREAVAKTV
jgi:GxGYxYP putative glycoside hydrolase C-terminal domain